MNMKQKLFGAVACGAVYAISAFGEGNADVLATKPTVPIRAQMSSVSAGKNFNQNRGDEALKKALSDYAKDPEEFIARRMKEDMPAVRRAIQDARANIEKATRDSGNDMQKRRSRKLPKNTNGRAVR